MSMLSLSSNNAMTLMSMSACNRCVAVACLMTGAICAFSTDSDRYAPLRRSPFQDAIDAIAGRRLAAVVGEQ
ncbi:hypothetical protein BUPH_08433 (plasmid) [Paraburkholderia phenoliruptrix BR3459a]|uniref:Uncharacterized protein n=1 Tax=Paraburkholderia phenoliruptrix BR3459a TaxID=1229205 RepID=K0E0A0_9BURK|nr:hypothetical protein BUPH_08433 [Paraburkholderia phenoliruptrix BR3459a]